MTRRALALCAAMVAACPAAAHATDIVVHVTGIVGSAGTIRVAACGPAEYETQHCRYKEKVPAKPGAVDIVIPDVPPGVYAIIAHHDWRDTGVVRTNWLGIPIEGVGVSRDAVGRFGPPAFADAALSISGPRVAVDITLRREPAP